MSKTVLYCCDNGERCRYLVERPAAQGTYFYCGFGGKKPPDAYVFPVNTTEQDLEYYHCYGRGKQ